jgi:hypothetical protein
MIPQFSSTELNHLLNLELAEGVYRQPEDALLAGLKLLRESRELGDEQVGDFLDEIDREVDAELASGSEPNV